MTAAVTREEADLLALARTAVGVAPAHAVTRLLLNASSAPSKLGPTAMGLLEKTLAQGTVLALARRGGWFREGGGRLWERTAPPSLHFTSRLLRLFCWIIQTPLGAADAPALTLGGELSPAEQMVLVLLLEQLAETGCQAALLAQPVVRATPLVALAHSAQLSFASADEVPTFDVSQLAVGIEGLRPLLAQAMLSAEHNKHAIQSPEAMIRMGQSQGAVLEAFLNAIDGAGQRVLASFLVDAALEWFRAPRSADDYTRALSAQAPLRLRSQGRHASGALLRALCVLGNWDQAHRTVRFFDEGYSAAQRLISDWGRFFPRASKDVASVLGELEAL